MRRVFLDAGPLGRLTNPRSREVLDGDCIFAAQEIQAAGPSDAVTVATSNVGHLSRFVDARTWDAVTA